MNQDTEIFVWDNTIIAREYISYIAEQAGAFARIGRDGKLYFRKIGEDVVELDKRFLKDMKWGDYFKISRIAYEDGVQDYKKGTVIDSTVWIDQDNMYITKQEQIDNIYDYYKNFECFSFEGSTIIDPAIDVGDIIVIDNKRIIYQGELSYTGKFKASIKSNVKNKTKQETSTKTKSEKARIRRIESKMNEVEGNIILLGKEVSEYEDKLSEIKLDVDSITQKVENVADLTREVSGATKIQLNDCMAGELIELHIEGNNTVFDSQYLSDDLYLDDDVDLFGDSFIKITRQVKDGEDVKEESEIIDLGIDTVLRQYEGVFDEYIVKDNKAQIIRRIGVDDEDNKYILENEIIEDLGEFILLLGKGTNYIEILNYVANIKAKYVVINDFTSKFATTVELKTSITQMADSINLTVSKKLNKKDVIAAINMAVLGKDDAEIPEDIEKSIIEILANKISIKSDNFELTKNGVIKAVAGTIAGLNMTTNNGNSFLSKNYINNNQTYQSGLYIPNTTNGSSAFLYAGAPINGTLADSNLLIRHDGLIKAKWFSVNGESGYFYVDYDNGQHAMTFDKYGIERYLNNGSHWTYEGMTFINDIAYGHTLFLYDAKAYTIRDIVHNQTLASFIKNDGANKPSNIWFYGDCWIDQNRTGSGSRILTAANYSSIVGSDRKLKKNIKTTNKKALEIINKIKFVEFDWNEKAKEFNKNGHVQIGVIANDVKEIDEDLVIYNEIDDIHSIDILNFNALNAKATQELSEENSELKKENAELKENQINMQKQIDFLINKLNCQEELVNYMKEVE